MKLTTEDLPLEERQEFESIQRLSEENKRVLWMLIKLSNKDHICIVNNLTEEIRALINLHFVSINPTYKHRSKTSLFVLRKTPHLMKKLQQLANDRT